MICFLFLGAGLMLIGYKAQVFRALPYLLILACPLLHLFMHKNHNQDNQKHDDKFHECPECGLHYANQEQAEKCQAWCQAHHSCNLEITSQAVENKLKL
ncbi:MAG: DUF2933 domain-containing protein [Candidatus Komeilibacteria bacterium]|nr:DUF2933 domain-containing protein [Candidatus Komeilibacteria bacterium]